jgi:phosphate transport system substrate-binding protein
MNDDFLHRIRAQPPADFLAQLKARLDRQPPPSASRPRRALFRTLTLGLLFGGSVFAITLLTVTGIPDAARSLIWTQHRQTDAGSDANQPNGHPHGIQPMFSGGGRREAEQASASDPNAEHGQQAQGARGAGVTAPNAAGSPTAPAVGGSMAPSRTPFTFVGPRGLQGYAAALAERSHRLGFDAIVAPADTTTEALARLCPEAGAAKGASQPTLAIATRRITPEEFTTCTRNIGSISEVPMGHQAVVVVRSQLYGALELSPRDLFLALAAEIPDPANPDVIIPNPNMTWNRVDGALENEPIEVVGPPPSSTTATALREMILDAGCNTFPTIAALQQTDRARHDRICGTIRKDGVYVEMAEVPDDVVQKLQLNPNVVGILGYGLFTSNETAFAASRISGVGPTRAAILAGAYAASRPIYVYVNQRTKFPMGVLLAWFSKEEGYLPETYSVISTDEAARVMNKQTPIGTPALPDLKM